MSPEFDDGRVICDECNREIFDGGYYYSSTHSWVWCEDCQKEGEAG